MEGKGGCGRQVRRLLQHHKGSEDELWARVLALEVVTIVGFRVCFQSRDDRI